MCRRSDCCNDCRYRSATDYSYSSDNRCHLSVQVNNQCSRYFLLFFQLKTLLFTVFE